MSVCVFVVILALAVREINRFDLMFCAHLKRSVHSLSINQSIKVHFVKRH